MDGSGENGMGDVDSSSEEVRKRDVRAKGSAGG